MNMAEICARLLSFLRMRLNLKVLLSLLVIAVFFTTVSYWTKCGGPDPSDHAFHLVPPKYDLPGIRDNLVDQGDINSLDQNSLNIHTLKYDEIECLINNEYTISCRQESNEVYLPFSFIEKYFEVYGKVMHYDRYKRFEWQHSYSKVYFPKSLYDPQGIFMSFENYNVEVRDRVKCVSGMEGVPISIQWGAHGYFYPIQIAQYGLSHFSKNLSETEPRVTIFENAELLPSKWGLMDLDASVQRYLDPITNQQVLEFKTPESISSAGVMMKVDQVLDFVLSLDIKFINNGSLSVNIESRDKQEIYTLHYVCSQTLIFVEGSNIYYGIGGRKQWSHITRDLSIDLQKGLAILISKSSRKAKLKPGKIRILSLILRGHGFADNITFSTTSHLSQFYDAADWLVHHQDEQGGWPIMVTRKVASGVLELAPGWYSAMAQGQAMSLLTRAFRKTGHHKYLQAALRATKLFNVQSADHGVMTKFAEKYVWYEEYPTIPSTFVLNGFIYSLIGLYDLKMTCSKEEGVDAEHLFKAGMDSLKVMLPLYDTGSGSIYDLRHFTLGVAPNLARWDYHTTHINQLLLLSTIDDDPILRTTAERWIGYMKGKRAQHN